MRSGSQHRSRAACALTLLCLLAPGRAGSEGVPVLTVGGKPTKLSELPPELGEGPRSAIETWAAWVVGARYRLDLDPTGRVLLITPIEAGGPSRELALVVRTLELFDGALPAPDRAPIAAASTQGASADKSEIPEDPIPEDPIPEDPEPEDPFPWQAASGEEGTSHTYVWGSELAAPDSQTIALLVLRDESDFDAVLDFLAERFEYLKAWKPKAGTLVGFTLALPLAGAHVLRAAGQEEWRPENELVNRLAQLLVLRRFGQQPHWLVQGWAWHVELSLLDSVYCFPDRTGFVYATEHSGWEDELCRRFAERKQKGLAIKDFASWKRGVYDDERGRIAWGVVRYAMQTDPGILQNVLEDQRLYYDQHSRREKGDGNWERKRDYEVPISVQRRFFQQRAGKGFFSEVADHYRRSP